MAGKASISNLLLLGGLAAGGWYVYKNHALKQLGAQTSNLKVKIDGVHVDTKGVVMDIDILNPNTGNIDIQSFVGTMYVDGKRVGDIQMFGDYNVKGNSQLTIPLVVTPLNNVFNAAMKAIVRGKSRIVFNGTVNANRTAIPMQISYTL